AAARRAARRRRYARPAHGSDRAVGGDRDSRGRDGRSERMKILTVCGMGLGTGLLLRMNTEEALKRIGVSDAEVTVADISTAKGMGASADIVLTSSELAEQLGTVKGRLVTVTNFFDKEEIERKLREALE